MRKEIETGSNRFIHRPWLSVRTLWLTIAIIFVLCHGAWADCVNVAGTWNTTYLTDARDCDEGIYTDYVTYEISQAGCNVTVVVDSGAFDDTINGNTLSWSGSYPEEGGTTTRTINLTFEGNSLTGTSSWTWSGFGESCSGTDQISGTRELQPPPEGYTGIQIVGTSSNIMTNVQVGDTVQFTVDALVHGGADVNYRFFSRAGYGEPDWGGNKWTIVQEYSDSNTVSVLFDTPGIYFLAGHVIHPGDTWVFGYPQSGIVVEVWPAQ